MAQPFMPIKAAEILDTIGVPESRRSLKWIHFAVDYGYGRPMRTQPLYLFPRLNEPSSHPHTKEELEAARASRRALKKEWRRKHLIAVGRDPDGAVEQRATRQQI
jgi:hypothetical protein